MYLFDCLFREELEALSLQAKLLGSPRGLYAETPPHQCEDDFRRLRQRPSLLGDGLVYRGSLFFNSLTYQPPVMESNKPSSRSFARRLNAAALIERGGRK